MRPTSRRWSPTPWPWRGWATFGPRRCVPGAPTRCGTSWAGYRDTRLRSGQEAVVRPGAELTSASCADLSGVYGARQFAECSTDRANAAAEIHSPLHSPGTQTPVAMRPCSRFGAVSKTVGGLWVPRGFESHHLRYQPGAGCSADHLSTGERAERPGRPATACTTCTAAQLSPSAASA